jgi:hypothetical protein
MKVKAIVIRNIYKEWSSCCINSDAFLYTCKGSVVVVDGCWMVRGRRRGSNVERQLIAVHMGDRESLLSADWRSSSYSDDTLYSRYLTLTRRNCIQHLAVWKKANRKWIVSLLWYIYTIDAFMSAVIGSNRVLSILLVIIRVNNGNRIKLCCGSCYFFTTNCDGTNK